MDALLQRWLLSLRVDGPGAAMRRVWSRLFGTEHRYVFVQPLAAPPVPVQFPVEVNGLVVRQMTEHDRDDVRVRRHEPHDVDRLALGAVATRQGEIVGAAWYTDSVTPAQAWYGAVEPHLLLPARFDANLFVRPGEKAAGWALSKNASDVLATAGIRSTVALVGVHNKRSILLLRLCGAKVVARVAIRRWFGNSTIAVEPVTEDKETGITPPDPRA